MGGVVKAIPMKDTYKVDKENRRKPIWTSFVLPDWSSEEDLKNMAFAIIVRNNNAIKQDNRCSLLKGLLSGRIMRESQR